MPSSFPAERWHEVERLLDAVLPLEPEARQAYLDTACADDPDLRHEVLHLLAFEARAAAAFDETDTDLVAPLLAAFSEPGSRTIGPYRLVRELGRGGMGTVYLAEREDVGKQVALKLVRGGLASSETRRRFLFERRVLARLDHPNIARLLDAGVIEDETPYFVMEYVEGETITTYCDRRHLDVDARLVLFQTVCEAVQYAHQRLVVHRDLKPSNILVGEAEGRQSQVKLLDFGIAKLLEEDEEAEAMTRTGLRMMTPEYAAPEQVLGDPVTTATDVYALGLLLYRLLTGQHPYRVQGQPHELSQVILNITPKKPSTAVWEASTTAKGARAITVERSTTVAELQRRLRGDLDVICLKALEKEPGRRYQSAEQLLEDLKRHVAGLPVVARPQTLGYRLQKFVRRHQWPVVGAALAVVVLVGFSITMVLQQAETARARDRAEAALTRSEAVTEFLTDLFEASDPFEAAAGTLTAYELMARGVERAEALSDEPEVQAQVLHVIGVVYERLEQYEKAESLLTQALTRRREVLGGEHPDVATSLNQLAWLLRKEGDYDAAEPLFREALGMRRQLLGEEHPDVATSLNDLAILLKDKGDHDAAEPLYREALAMRRRLLGEEHTLVAVSLSNLGLLLWHNGDYDAAEPLFREALAMQRKLRGEQHPEVASVLTNLALVLEDKGDLVAAESLFRQGLAMDRNLLGAEHSYVATDLQNLARILRDKGDYDAAEPLFREALAIRRRLLGEEHPHVAISLYELAVLHKATGDYDAAEPLFQEALAMQRKLLGEAHPGVATAMTGLAGLLREKGDYAAAEPMLRAALAIMKTTLGPDHPATAKTLRELARLYEAWGKPDQAARYQALLQTGDDETR